MQKDIEYWFKDLQKSINMNYLFVIIGSLLLSVISGMYMISVWVTLTVFMLYLLNLGPVNSAKSVFIDKAKSEEDIL